MKENDIVRALPPTLRDEIGSAYLMARTVEPARKVGYTRHVVSALIIGTRITKEYEENKELLELCTDLCSSANLWYSNGNWRGALYICDKILDDIGTLVYAGYGKIPDSAFMIPVTTTTT
jgi:hypothetical protein